jgi:hypothetical protein
VKALFVLPVVSLLSLGVVPVLMYWYESLKCSMAYSECQSIEKATHLKVINKQGAIYVCELGLDKVRSLV